MTRFLVTFSGALFVGSIGAFFLFVPPLLIATVALLLMGFTLTFMLGLQIGAHSMLEPLPQPIEIAGIRDSSIAPHGLL
jgi:hypothetical protein